MNTKSLIFLASLFATQLISSCCSQSTTFEVNIEEVIINAFGDPGERSGSISKESFGVSVEFLTDFNEVSTNSKPGSDFVQANANPFNTCGDDYRALDNVIEFKLYAFDHVRGERSLVNSAFLIDESDVIDELMTSGNDEVSLLYNHMIFELRNPMDISDSATFTIEVTLESGIVFSADSEIITFE